MYEGVNTERMKQCLNVFQSEEDTFCQNFCNCLLLPLHYFGFFLASYHPFAVIELFSARDEQKNRETEKTEKTEKKITKKTETKKKTD